MAESLRFVQKRAAVADLPAGIAVRYEACPEQDGDMQEPRFVFDLPKAHLGNNAHCRLADGAAFEVTWSAREAGTWRLKASSGDLVAVASRRGALKSGIRLTGARGDTLAEFVDPAGLSEQILRSALNGGNDTYVCLAGGKPVARLARLPRGGERPSGMLGRLKGLLATFDWVLVPQNGATARLREEVEPLPLCFATLVAIVDLEFADT